MGWRLVGKSGCTVGWGNGAVDFAGSGVVHMIGGSLALAGAIVIGPRIGRFNKDGSPNSMPGHNIPMGILGTIILFFGWFGLTLVLRSALAVHSAILRSLQRSTHCWRAQRVACLPCSICGGLVLPKKPDPGLSVNGILAGLVVITAPCAFVSTWAAVVIGLIAGVLACWATFTLEKLKIDDPGRCSSCSLYEWSVGCIGSGYLCQR